MRKSRVVIGLLVLVVLIALGLWLDPTHVGRGYLRGETFYEGRPASYWSEALVSDPATSSHAIEQLKQPRPESVEVLLAIARDTSQAPDVRWTAIELLGEMGSAAERAGPVLLAALEDPDPHVVAVAAATLPEVGLPPEQAVPALINLLDSKHTTHQVVAARAISEYKGDGRAALEPLVELLENKSMQVEARWNAARTLGKLGAAGADAIPVLTAHLKDEEDTIREHAAEALGDIGPPAESSVPDLVAVLDDSAVRVRRDAVRSLGQIGGAARDAIPEMEKLLKDPEKIVQEAAAAAIEKLNKGN